MEIEIGSHRKYSAKGRNRATPETFRREFDAIFPWLRERLKDRGYACFVIGDSRVDGARRQCVVARGGGGRRRIPGGGPDHQAPTRKSFNPRIGLIKQENMLILQKA